jgi:hypothetical protein
VDVEQTLREGWGGPAANPRQKRNKVSFKPHKFSDDDPNSERARQMLPAVGYEDVGRLTVFATDIERIGSDLVRSAAAIHSNVGDLWWASGADARPDET